MTTPALRLEFVDVLPVGDCRGIGERRKSRSRPAVSCVSTEPDLGHEQYNKSEEHRSRPTENFGDGSRCLGH